jgi:hypothetical protein
MEQAGTGYRKNRHNKKNWNRPRNPAPQENPQQSAKKAAALADRARMNREVMEKLQQEQTGNREAMKSFRQEKHICHRCSNVIQEVASALIDRSTGEPMHFDCVLAMLNEQEQHAPSEKIVYIGQGRFGVVHFENPSDPRHFSIHRVIEWESVDKPASWRSGIAGLFSRV